MMTHKELKMKALADPETMAEYEAQKPEFELLDKLLEATKRAGSRRSINMTTKGQYGTSEMARDFGGLTFGNALSSYRIGEEKSQREFAGFLGISPQSLCDIEKERRIPSPSRAAKIARQLGESESFWVQLALQDMLRKENLDLVVSID